MTDDDYVEKNEYLLFTYYVPIDNNSWIKREFGVLNGRNLIVSETMTGLISNKSFLPTMNILSFDGEMYL